jgi:hypothetical protein
MITFRCMKFFLSYSELSDEFARVKKSFITSVYEAIFCSKVDFKLNLL